MSASVEPLLPLKRVLVLSYLNYKNFGDRLGFHVLNALLPANIQLVHAPLDYSHIPDGRFDMMILGLGQSLNAGAILRPELLDLVGRIPHTIGIFGTQYPSQYRTALEPRQFRNLLGRLTAWWARYETDIRDHGEGCAGTRHLGDWLIAAFPLTEPRVDRSLTIEADSSMLEAPLDRMIQWIQGYHQVHSGRLHPLLCALTSAERVSYREQREGADSNEISGKFESMLRDIFGRSWPEDEVFEVDRAAVVRYKMKVEANMAALREQIVDLLR
jgi:hypothetical protein